MHISHQVDSTSQLFLLWWRGALHCFIVGNDGLERLGAHGLSRSVWLWRLVLHQREARKRMEGGQWCTITRTCTRTLMGTLVNTQKQALHLLGSVSQVGMSVGVLDVCVTTESPEVDE